VTGWPREVFKCYGLNPVAPVEFDGIEDPWVGGVGHVPMGLLPQQKVGVGGVTSSVEPGFY